MESSSECRRKYSPTISITAMANTRKARKKRGRKGEPSATKSEAMPEKSKRPIKCFV